MALFAIALLIFAPMIVEAARSAGVQHARGGLERRATCTRLNRLSCRILAMLAERGSRVVSGSIVVVVVGATSLGRNRQMVAILALGRSWTFRVIVVPGDVLVASGPYRYFRHPNYVGVVGELAGAALMTRALLTGPIAVLLFAVLLHKRIAVEERALKI